jgi:hypothetical protein
VGVDRAKTFDTRGAARSAKDRGLAGAGLSVDRGAGEREKVVIHWSDETDVRDQDQIGPFGKSSGGYAPQGQTLVLTQTRQTFSLSMIAAVSNRGLMRFTLYKAP